MSRKDVEVIDVEDIASVEIIDLSTFATPPPKRRKRHLVKQLITPLEVIYLDKTPTPSVKTVNIPDENPVNSQELISETEVENEILFNA
jgi:hypothetical protein